MVLSNPHLAPTPHSSPLLHNWQGWAERRSACPHPHGWQAALCRACQDGAFARHV